MTDENKDDPAADMVELTPGPNVEIGFIDDPEDFDIGMEGGQADSIVFLFRQEGEPFRALGFRGEASEKLLTSFYALLSLLYGSTQATEEELGTVDPKNKKLTTLH